MRFKIFLLAIFIIGFSPLVFAVPKSTFTFSSGDGIKITADRYIAHQKDDTPIIVLFHQAGWSRGEYLEIAPKPNQLGFNCIAVDLRSGDTINGIDNETVLDAIHKDKNTRYIDALPDIKATLKYTKTNYSNSKFIAWGSSYSAALVLHVPGEDPDLVNGVLSFAPGEYFAKQGKSKSWIKDSASQIKVPVFITFARNEHANWTTIFSAVPSNNKSSFIPTSKGNHGTRALWGQF